eukprot:CAMPEP_0202980352 /NCGR_PEP_ID=MMETSP1396-20130829/86298_1 /ASSEMBLY_ACC=CAM_ASM_000872 /TAXON_ID= /ORGANISM="Pseudokeronopsis sp., Strain Brazil" /LENGTH=235 /DNA_ID=CAMNT_0049720287 /DNA_START=2028 /DNA_END=2735 /DNA_ORIENTATION=-
MSENIDSDNSIVEVRVGALYNFIVFVFCVVECVESFEEEFEDALEVLWSGGGEEDVAVAVDNGACETDAEGGRLAAPSAGGEGKGGAQVLLGDAVHHLHHRLRLVHRPAHPNHIANRFCVFELQFQLRELVLLFVRFWCYFFEHAFGDGQNVEFVVQRLRLVHRPAHPNHISNWFCIFELLLQFLKLVFLFVVFWCYFFEHAFGDGQNVEFVVHGQTGAAVPQTQNEPLVEPGLH